MANKYQKSEILTVHLRRRLDPDVECQVSGYAYRYLDADSSLEMAAKTRLSMWMIWAAVTS